MSSVTKVNLVGHCRDTKENHDKLYIACIRVATRAMCFEVIGKWGRVGHILSAQPKGMFLTLHEARAAQNSLFASKMAKGYVDIESVGYKGPLTMNHPAVKPYLEPDIARGEKQPVNDPNANRAAPTPRDEFKSASKWPIEVLCVDNSGFEEKFDIDITYIATKYDSQQHMLTVHDKFGKAEQFRSERFKKV